MSSNYRFISPNNTTTTILPSLLFLSALTQTSLKPKPLAKQLFNIALDTETGLENSTSKTFIISSTPKITTTTKKSDKTFSTLTTISTDLLPIASKLPTTTLKCNIYLLIPSSPFLFFLKTY